MNNYKKALVFSLLGIVPCLIYYFLFATTFQAQAISMGIAVSLSSLSVVLGHQSDKSDEPHAENVVKAKRRRFSIKPPHPTLVLLTLIMGMIGLFLFLPPEYNYYNWFGYAWTAFWWLWLFPFFFLKIYDWAHVRSLRKGGGGSNPMLRLIGILVLVMIIGFLVLIVLINLIGFLLGLASH